jgi:hypothetical protein
MAENEDRTKPKLWEKVKAELLAGDKGGKPDQWSARKAQMAVREYRRRGGDYHGARKTGDSLKQWSDQDWGTKSGERSRDTGERYLPKKTRKKLTESEYAATSEKKKKDTKKGHQYSAQPSAIARKSSRLRDNAKAD